VRCWLAGGEEHQGRLVDVDEARLTLDDGGQRVELPRDRVTKARLDGEVPWPRRAGI
jgi:ribosome maturation factor RimP